MSRFHPEQQLILLSAGTAARRNSMSGRARKLAGDLDWAQLAETLRWRKLLPTLGPRIVALADGSVSDDFGEAVEQAIVTARRQGAFLQLIALRILAMLAEEGISALSLKGPTLSEAVYGDPGRRLSSDIDLLVAPEQLRAAAEVVRDMGYEAPTDHVEHGGLPLLHFALVHERGELPPVELHWRVHWYERSFATERLLPPTVDPLGSWRPAPVDELFTLLLFYARDGFIDLRLATDLGAWWDVYGDDLSPGACEEALRAYPALAHVIPVAATVAEKVVGIPSERIIPNRQKLGVRDRMVVRLANPNPHASQSQLYADRGLIDGLLTPRGHLRAFIRRQVLPPREVLDQQARHGARRRRRSALSRCAGVLVRYGLTMTRLVRSPETLR